MAGKKDWLLFISLQHQDIRLDWQHLGNITSQVSSDCDSNADDGWVIENRRPQTKAQIWKSIYPSIFLNVSQGER